MTDGAGASTAPEPHPDMTFLASITPASSVEHRAIRTLADAWDWDLDDLPLARRLVAALRQAGLLVPDEKPEEQP